MTNPESDGLFDHDWDERSEVSWTEADWARYLAEQDAAVKEYLGHYEQLAGSTERLDEAARRMGWQVSETPATEDTETEDPDDTEVFESDWEPYTLHRNPVYTATQALTLSLLAAWERATAAPDAVPVALALQVQAALYRGHTLALQAVQALDLGDYTLALCFFKRALRELNGTLALLNRQETVANGALAAYRDFALPRLFDLREIWLRVMSECRLGDE